jgi:hypothetical protein
MPPGLPVMIGASLIVFGVRAAEAARLEDSPHFIISLAQRPLGGFGPASAQRRRPLSDDYQGSEPGEVGLDPVQDSYGFLGYDSWIGQHRAFIGVAQETRLHHNCQRPHFP